MKHFDEIVISEKYDNARPFIHPHVVKIIADLLELDGKFEFALDLACGTGQSIEALLNISKHVIGCDISYAMLEQAKKRDVSLVQTTVERLPFSENSVDMITVGFAFHWFDQKAFLLEASRLLKPGRCLCLYNFNFPGVMLSNALYQQWHQQVYWKEFPNPKRHKVDVEALLKMDDIPFVLRNKKPLAFKVGFAEEQLLQYLLSQSNISVALKEGKCLEEISAWIKEDINPYFQSDSETFEYNGELLILENNTKSVKN